MSVADSGIAQLGRGPHNGAEMGADTAAGTASPPVQYLTRREALAQSRLAIAALEPVTPAAAESNAVVVPAILVAGTALPVVPTVAAAEHAVAVADAEPAAEPIAPVGNAEPVAAEPVAAEPIAFAAPAAAPAPALNAQATLIAATAPETPSPNLLPTFTSRAALKSHLATTKRRARRPAGAIRSKSRRHVVLISAVALACAPIVIALGLAYTGNSAGASGNASQAASAPTPSASVAPAPVVATEPTVSSMVSADSVTPIPEDGSSTGPVTGGTMVTLTGADLDTVATVTFGANAGTVVAATETTITIETPASTDYDPGVVPVELLNAAGTALVVMAEAPMATPAPDARSAPAPTASAVPEPLMFSYVPDPRITAQMAYVNAHWNDYNGAEYGVLRGNDCVNFASQSLIKRGWTMDDAWSFDLATNNYSLPWASSTAFDAYLLAHPERALPLTDEQRSEVKVGDIVQFDWDRSGDRDHTGIVTAVIKTDAGVQVEYAGHTFNTISQSVDESLANSGGTVSYWSIK